MRGTQATSCGNVETFQLIIFNDGNQSNIICKNIHIIIWRNSNSNFKFSRQVTILVERIFFLFSIYQWFLIKPDLVI